MGRLFHLIGNSIALELRMRELVVSMATLTVILAAILGFGINASVIEPTVHERLFSPLLWAVFILTASVSVGRAFEYELENRAIDAIVLSGVSPSTIYLSKWISQTILLFPLQLWAVLCLAVLLNVSVSSHFGALLLVSLPVVSAYTALATLLAGISVSGRLKQLLLPLILLPLLFPLLLAAIELSMSLIVEGSIDWRSPWCSLLAVLNVLYVTLGINLFEYVIQE